MPTPPASSFASLRLFFLCATLGACSRPSYGPFNAPPSHGGLASTANPTTTHGAVEEFETVQVPTLTRETDVVPAAEYTIGPRDELMIEVAPHDNAGLPQSQINGGGGGGNANANIGTGGRAGATTVHDDGTIQILGIGTFRAAGLTPTQLSDELKKKYAAVIVDPEVLVEIKAYKSQIVYLSGQFGKPGPLYLDRRTDMLQLIAQAGNPTAAANLRGAYVVRKNREGKSQILNVDLYSLLEEGNFSQNIWIHPDDFLYIPDNSKQVVVVLGNVGRPGPIQLEKDNTLSLTKAMALAGDVKQFGTDWEKFRIIRPISPTRGEFIVVNYQKIRDGEVMDFQLKAGDVVYVANTRLGDWNAALAEIQPSLQLVGNVLQPFVQLKVLQQSFKN